MKKALVCIHTAKSFCDFLWYYVTYGEEYDWDVVVDTTLSYEEQEQYYKSKGLFKNIYGYRYNIWDKKYSLFARYIINYITFGRKRFARKIINEIVDIDSYERIVLIGNCQPLEGAIMCLADEKNVVMLEDGVLDYIERTDKFIKLDKKWVNNVAFYLLAKMGYISPCGHYKVKNTRNCDKFCTFPERLDKTEFRSLNKLKELNESNRAKYEEYIKKIFELDIDTLNKPNKIVLFTAPLAGFAVDVSDEIKRTVEYIKEKYPDSNIFIKRHPKDLSYYDFGDSVNVIEINKSIPGEIVLDNFSFDNEIYMFPSGILMNLIGNHSYEILYYESIEAKMKSGAPDYKSNFNKAMSLCNIDNCHKRVI